MKETLKFLNTVIDERQKGKVKHKMSDIIAIVFFAMLTKAENWQEIHTFAINCEGFLRKYLDLANGIPSHDTIERVFSVIDPKFLQQFRDLWNESIQSDEGNKIQRLLAIDGKTQRGNKSETHKPNHIVTAVTEAGISIGETVVDAKENEIKAIPKLLDALNIKNSIITIDAMGTQTEIAAKIRSKHADYVLALKGNQNTLHEDVKQYFADTELLAKSDYHRTVEKARGGIEKREYWQTDNIAWLPQKSKWRGLKSIGMTKNTITKQGVTTEETRYFICSLAVDAKEFARAVRGHWMVESFHWHLDVTFREDSNHTLDKISAFNLNIIRKLALAVLKLYDTGVKGASLRTKRYGIGLNPEKHLAAIIKI